MPPEAAAAAVEVTTSAPSAPAVVELPSPSKSKGPSLDDAIAKAVAGVTHDEDEPEEKPAAAPEKPKAKEPGKGKERLRRVEKLEAKAVEKAAEAPAAAPEPEGNALEKARYYLQHGDVAKAVDVAFGELKLDGLPDQVREALARKLGTSSAQWERLRKHEQSTKRAAAARESELRGIVSQLQQEYEPLHKARQAYQSNDFETAFKLAFGEDAADFQRKVIGQRVGKNPEIEALKEELRKRDERAESEKRAAAEEAHRAEMVRAQTEYLGNLRTELAASEDADIARFAQKPAFAQRVFAVLRDNYDARTGTTVPVRVAAEHVRDQVFRELQEWGHGAPGAQPAQTVQAGAPPAKQPARAAVRTLKQTQAAEAVGTPAKRSSKEIMAHHQSLMERLAPE